MILGCAALSPDTFGIQGAVTFSKLDWKQVSAYLKFVITFPVLLHSASACIWKVQDT